MSQRSGVFALLLSALGANAPYAQAAATATAIQTQPVTPGQLVGQTAVRDLAMTVGKSVVVESLTDVQRVSVGNDKVAEAVVVGPREIVVNGKLSGQTTLIVWQEGGRRLLFDVTVRAGSEDLDMVRREIREQLPGQKITVKLQRDSVFLEGTATDLASAERAAAIASTVGKVVNLLNVVVPPTDAQVLLKVRFANVDRTAVQELGVNFFSTGATIGGVTTGQFTPPRIAVEPDRTTFSLTDALNVFLFRRDLNLGATIRALANRRLLEILAEPNVLAINGKTASFLAGGEFPYPILQGGGAGLGAVTIQFREFGVRINFLPRVTPRGTIRLRVSPEVSALDYANGLVFQGFTIPGLTTRRVQTEIELESGQSFAIGGLLDNRLTESLSKIPGLGDLPLLGKLFQSRSVTKNKSELLVLVTPELVRPIPADQEKPDLEMPNPDFIQEGAKTPPRTPPVSVTGSVPVHGPRETIPVEQLMESLRQDQRGAGQPGQPASGGQYPVQFVPVVPAAPVPEGMQAPASGSAAGTAPSAAQPSASGLQSR